MVERRKTMFKNFGPGAVGVDLPFPEAAALAASHGFEGIQVDVGYLSEHGPDRYREILAEHGLRNGSFGLPFTVDGDPDEYERGLETLREVGANAEAIGCDRCSTYLMSFSDERPYEENFAYFTERLEPVATILSEHGIRLGLEFLGPLTLREGHEFEFVHDIEGMLELCEAVDPDTVGLLLDSWHWYTAGDTVETLASLTADDVVDVHVNDAPSGIPRDEQVDSVRRLPGETGVIDIESFLGELDRMGYDGPVTIEPFSDELNELDPEETAERTKRSLDRIWEQAGL